MTGSVVQGDCLTHMKKWTGFDRSQKKKKPNNKDDFQANSLAASCVEDLIQIHTTNLVSNTDFELLGVTFV